MTSKGGKMTKQWTTCWGAPKERRIDREHLVAPKRAQLSTSSPNATMKRRSRVKEVEDG